MDEDLAYLTSVDVILKDYDSFVNPRGAVPAIPEDLYSGSLYF